MRVDDHLDAIRAAAPGCRIAAFADLAALTVLAVSSDRRYPQEDLDRLCRDASEALDGPLASAAGAGPPREAVVLGPDDARFFLRMSSQPNEVLCCILAAGTAPGPLRIAARDALGRIADLTA